MANAFWSQDRRPGPINPAKVDDLARIKVPALVLIGETDVPYLQIVARVLAYYLQRSQLAVVAGGGHMINLVEPNRYNTTLLGFLASAGQVSAK